MARSVAGIAGRLGPARSCTSAWGLTRRCAGRRCGRFGAHRAAFVTRLIQNQSSAFVVAIRQQRRYFAKLVGGCLERLDLLGQLRILSLLAAQYLVDVLHSSP